MRIWRRWRLCVLVGLLMASLTFDGAAVAPRASAATTVTVRIRDNFFKPKTITIHKGDRVRWVNKGANHHTSIRKKTPVTWNSGDLAPGDTFTKRFKRTGTFRYYCKYHRALGMRAKVVVKP